MTTSDSLEQAIRDIRQSIAYVEAANRHERGTVAETKLREALNAIIDLHKSVMERGE